MIKVRVCRLISFIFSFEFLGEVFWGEFMVVHVTVLGSTGEGVAILREADRVDGSEMTSDFCELFVENNTVHFHVETTFTCCCGCHIFGVLASSTYDVELLVFGIVKERAEDCTSDRLTVVEHADFLKSFRVQDLGSVVMRSSAQHGEVVSEVNRVDVVSVDLLFLHLFSIGSIVLNHSTVSRAGVDSLIKSSPAEVGEPIVSIAGDLNNGLNFFVCERRVHDTTEVVDSDERLFVSIVLNCNLFVTV